MQFIRVQWVRLAVLTATLIVTATLPASAQTGGVIVGAVTESSSGAVVSDAVVFLEGTSRQAITSEEGRFVFSEVAGGSYVVVVERIGLESTRRAVDVTPGTTVRLTIEMADSPITMSRIVVTASRDARDRSTVPAAIGVVDRSDLENTTPSHPSDVMGRMAGVWVNTTGGEGHMTAIRQPLTTNPVYLYLEDGVPTRSTGFFNHNALYEINVPQAERIEVMKGPGNALYGSDAIGGVINVQTRRPTDASEGRVTVEGGGHGYRRILGRASGTFGGNGLSATLNVTDTEGWRSGTAFERQSGTLRWDRSTESGWYLKGIASFSNIDQQTAGSSALPRELFETAPTTNLTPISFREVGAVRLSLAMERRLGNGSLSLTPFYRFNSMDILPNWSLTFDPAIWETQNHSVGLLAKYAFLPMSSLRVTTGVDLDMSPGEHFETAIDPTRTDGVFTDYEDAQDIYDYDVTYRQVAPYLQTAFTPTPTVTVTAGVRGDFMEYDYQNHLDVVQTGPHRRPDDATPGFSRISPKFGVTFAPTRALSVFGAYREGFRAPSEGQLFRQGTSVNTVDLEPVKVQSVEAGVRGLLLNRFSYEVSTYRMEKTDDILRFDRPDGNRETQNAGETLHRGIEAQIGVELVSGLQLDVAYSWAKHTYELWRPNAETNFSGNEMEFAPNEIGNVVLSYSIPGLPDSNVSLEWKRLGPYWEDAANTQEYEGHDLLDARLNLPLGTSGVMLFARLQNLTDERYAERASFNAFRGEELAPGLPRTLYAGLKVTGGF